MAGSSDKSFNWAHKILWPLPSSRNLSSAASQRRATTSGVTLAGRKEQHTGYEPPPPEEPQAHRLLAVLTG
jgi:hypothetical protein